MGLLVSYQIAIRHISKQNVSIKRVDVVFDVILKHLVFVAVPKATEDGFWSNFMQ